MPSAQAISAQTFTLLDEGRVWRGEALLDGNTPWLPAEALAAATGWELKPQGVCRNDVCVPAAANPELVRDGRVSVGSLAEALGRPLAVDTQTRTAYLGASSAERARRLASLDAPDFALPDLQGRVHRLSDQRGRKVLLVAYASW